MNNIYVLGDIHGEWRDVRAIANTLESLSRPLDETDIIIQVGDFGANFFITGHRDEEFKKKLGKYKCTFFVVRGNHEERPSNLYYQHPEKWHLESFFGGNVYVENAYPYIKYAADMPFQYNINGHSTLTLPGAYSIDKYHRLANGWSWFKDEQMTEAEMEIGRMIVKAVPNWDLVLSHTCPIVYEPTDLFLSNVDQSTVDKTMERYFGELEQELNYKLWCWGHYHQTRVYPQFDDSNRVMLYNDAILDLNKFFETKNPYDALIKIKGR